MDIRQFNTGAAKHPAGRDVQEEAKIPSRDNPPPEPVRFEEIDAELVEKCARRLKGSGGPTQIDAATWRTFLSPRSFGNTSLALCQGVADCTRLL